MVYDVEKSKNGIFCSAFGFFFKKKRIIWYVLLAGMIECCMHFSSTSMVDFNVHLYFCPIIGVCVIHVCSDTDKKLQLTFFVLHLEFLTLIIWHLL